VSELYLIRHGVAEERGDRWPDDNKRPLTEDGISKLRKIARALVRARQTAEIVAAGLDPHPHITTLESLSPGGTFASIMSDLEKHTKRSRIALVGHEPGIGELAARLIGTRHAIPFKKGAVCRIDIEGIPPAGPGDLRWFLTPRMMRLIKK
jgi:phosphohistidine phosphatase